MILPGSSDVCFSSSGTSKSSPVKPKRVRKPSRPAGRAGGLPRSYLMNVFKHFAKAKVSADVYPVLKEVYVPRTFTLYPLYIVDLEMKTSNIVTSYLTGWISFSSVSRRIWRHMLFMQRGRP